MRPHLLPALLLLPLVSSAAQISSVLSPPLETGPERSWIGPAFWANRLQDWRLREGRAECLEGSERLPVRTLHLLPWRLREGRAGLVLTVRTGPLGEGKLPAGAGTGFLLGAGGADADPRLATLVHCRPAEDGGILAVLEGNGRCAFRDFSRGAAQEGIWAVTGPLEPGDAPLLAAGEPGLLATAAFAEVELRLRVRPGAGGSDLELTAADPATGLEVARAELFGVDPARLAGGLALVSHLGAGGRGFWFKEWTLAGPAALGPGAGELGPVLSVLYTVSRGTLKLTAQLMPLAEGEASAARLEAREPGGGWRPVAAGLLDPASATAAFRVQGWDAGREREVRVVLERTIGPGRKARHDYEATIRKDPQEGNQFTLAAFTGHKCYSGSLRWNGRSLWFPHADIVAAVRAHAPDLLFFSGDQVYEGDLTPAEKRPLARARLDYLYKWYRWCWAFAPLTRTRPAVVVPDDHDVYHGNLWGAGGRAAKAQDDGGYCLPPEFVNLVQRTQTGHLPDPPDPAPAGQGIGVYFTDLLWGGVSFAILEDRKWKSSPTAAVPAGRFVNGWAREPGFDPVREADVPGAVLLGDRQLAFLRRWAGDWSGGAWFKVALSQTLFANVATLPRGAKADEIVPRLERLALGAYPPDDEPVADADSNGWPQTGRNLALRELRKAFALHVAGDQHLGSTVHYGIEEWEDGPLALCVPSVANAWPRRWYPCRPGEEREAGAPRCTGRYRDGFGNLVTVRAVSNPELTGREPAGLHDKAPGYGIVRLDKAARRFTLECWPRWADPTALGARPYPGWPITATQRENYGRKPRGWLPTLLFPEKEEPVIQVAAEGEGGIVYTLRASGGRFAPFVFAPGLYTVRVGDGEGRWSRILAGLEPRPGEKEAGEIRL